MKASTTRRTILAQAAAAGVLAAIPRRARGAAEPTRFVAILLRGGLDGLAAVPAYGDRHYRIARGGLALRAPGSSAGIVDLDGFFGLHPALASLHRFYAGGQMLVLPAAATSYRGRLHGPARAFLDGGVAEDGTARAGWLGRAAALLTEGDERGGVIWRAPRAAGMPLDGRAGLVADLCHHHAGLARLLASCGTTGPDGAPQTSAFRDDARELGTVLSAGLSGGIGPHLAVLESHGWDTHAEQGAHAGRLAIALVGLADGLVALAEASGDAWRHTVVLVATEFGRSIRMNSMGGTDHGIASAAFLLGGAVAGGRIVGPWPGLAPDRLHRGGDLVRTIDLHAVVKAVLIEHMGLPRESVERIVLPGVTAMGPPGLLRA
jgi:uncharacterized protein (DUF1501 family)